MKTFRAARHGETTQKVAASLAEHWGGSVQGLRGALGVAHVVPGPLKLAVTKAVRTVAPKDWIPEVGGDLPGAGARRTAARDPQNAALVFFSSCMGALFAPQDTHHHDHHEEGAAEAFLKLADAAGLPVKVPEDLPSLCCGTPWVSKGITKGAEVMSAKVFDSLWEATDHGRLPVVCDASSCSQGILGLADHLDPDRGKKWQGVTVYDSVTYVAHEIVPKLHPQHKLPRIVVHPTCSLIHLGAVDDLVACGKAAADEVHVPFDAGCCAFAGDRGMLHPELTASATALEAAEVEAEGPFDAYASANRTCEMGMTRATGHEYQHVLELLVDAL